MILFDFSDADDLAGVETLDQQRSVGESDDLCIFGDVGQMHIFDCADELAGVVTQNVSVAIRGEFTFGAVGGGGTDSQEVHADDLQVGEVVGQVTACGRSDECAVVLIDILVGVSVLLHTGTDQSAGNLGQDVSEGLQIFLVDAFHGALGDVEQCNISMCKVFHSQFADGQAVLYEVTGCIHVSAAVVGHGGNKAAEGSGKY